jgi:hypothetical protein
MAAIDYPRMDAGDSVAERAEGTLLYESGRTRVLRTTVTSPVPLQAAAGGARSAAMDVIWKVPLGAGAAERRRHEMAVLAGLAAVPGVAHLVPSEASDGFAVEDVGGVPLAAVLVDAGGGGLAAGVGAADLVRFGLDLARVLAGVHRAGVMHKDLNPANILVVGPDRQPVLIDWDLATTFAVERPGFTHESTIAGTLAYLAPEQSGRTGRGVDQRAHLYSLGATLYECAVGRPPFGFGDALTLIHDHLALVQVAPSVLNVTVPVVLSDIIMRLLEKEPDRRYQSAQGLAHDLARLSDSLTAAGSNGASVAERAGFALGERDFPIRICAPSQLVGRDVEIGQLSAALEQALAGGGRGLLVTGAPGVGKSSLIGELRSMVTAKSGWFVQGKFDQNRQDGSTDAVAQVIQALARLLLAEPEEQLADAPSSCSPDNSLSASTTPSPNASAPWCTAPPNSPSSVTAPAPSPTPAPPPPTSSPPHPPSWPAKKSAVTSTPTTATPSAPGFTPRGPPATSSNAASTNPTPPAGPKSPAPTSLLTPRSPVSSCTSAKSPTATSSKTNSATPKS